MSDIWTYQRSKYREIKACLERLTISQPETTNGDIAQFSSTMFTLMYVEGKIALFPCAERKIEFVEHYETTFLLNYWFAWEAMLYTRKPLIIWLENTSKFVKNTRLSASFFNALLGVLGRSDNKLLLVHVVLNFAFWELLFFNLKVFGI